MPQKNKRPPIPQDIKKEVRKRCGYGCIFCGSPIYQIDHIVDWSIVKEHKAENLTLLCGYHHDQKTKGMVSKKAVIEANENPYAINHPDSLVSKWFFGGTLPSFELATNTFQYPVSELNLFAPFVIEGDMPLLFTLEDGHLLLNLVAHDTNGEEILRIDKNEMLLIPKKYDIEIVGSRVVIRQSKRSILLDLLINTENSIVKIEKLKIVRGDTLISVANSSLKMDGRGFQNFFYHGCTFRIPFGISIDTPNVSAAISLNSH